MSDDAIFDALLEGMAESLDGDGVAEDAAQWKHQQKHTTPLPGEPFPLPRIGKDGAFLHGQEKHGDGWRGVKRDKRGRWAGAGGGDARIVGRWERRLRAEKEVGDGSVFDTPKVVEPTEDEARGVKLGRKQLGLCYDTAGRYLMDHDEATLVHGTVDLAENWPIGHGWIVTETGKVFDGTQGQFYDKTDYYAKLNAKEERTYSPDQARVQMIRTKVWGPWHETEGWTRDVDGGLKPGASLQREMEEGFKKLRAMKKAGA